jgi:hypothetical protein
MNILLPRLALTDSRFPICDFLTADMGGGDGAMLWWDVLPQDMQTQITNRLQLIEKGWMNGPTVYKHVMRHGALRR